MSTPTGYQCRTCNQWHEGIPLAWGPEAPIYWYGLTPEDRTRRFLLGSDTAILDDEHYFIRGRIEIPIRGFDDPFVWLVWSSLGKSDYERATEAWTKEGREKAPPMFGWLSTELPGYPSTVNLKVHVHTQRVGERPLIEIEPTDHPLAQEQLNGIDWARVEELAERLQHGGDESGA